MKETSEKFLNLFFNKGESINISPDKYAYHSIDWSDLTNIPMKSPNSKVRPFSIKEDDISLMALNPINGFRNDENVTAFRSFLVEIDEGSLVKQKKYIEDSGLPYSVCVFSGNKSLHYGVVLDSDLLTLQIWRHINKWILNILSEADQQTLNPSRCIRFPNHKRKNGRALIQSLVDIRGRVSQTELFIWLNKFSDKKPVEKMEEIKNPDYDPKPILAKLPKYFNEMLIRLNNDSQPNRNSSWFHLGCIMARYNFELEETISYLSNYFSEESDFKYKEWYGCVKSAYKKENKDV